MFLTLLAGTGGRSGGRQIGRGKGKREEGAKEEKESERLEVAVKQDYLKSIGIAEVVAGGKAVDGEAARKGMENLPTHWIYVEEVHFGPAELRCTRARDACDT